MINRLIHKVKDENGIDSIIIYLKTIPGLHKKALDVVKLNEKCTFYGLLKKVDTYKNNNKINFSFLRFPVLLISYILYTIPEII